jgi:hypothetical protein
MKKERICSMSTCPSARLTYSRIFKRPENKADRSKTVAGNIQRRSRASECNARWTRASKVYAVAQTAQTAEDEFMQRLRRRKYIKRANDEATEMKETNLSSFSAKNHLI